MNNRIYNTVKSYIDRDRWYDSVIGVSLQSSFWFSIMLSLRILWFSRFLNSNLLFLLSTRFSILQMARLQGEVSKSDRHIESDGVQVNSSTGEVLPLFYKFLWEVLQAKVLLFDEEDYSPQ
jgi:hypothetical protein